MSIAGYNQFREGSYKKAHFLVYFIQRNGCVSNAIIYLATQIYHPDDAKHTIHRKRGERNAKKYTAGRN